MIYLKFKQLLQKRIIYIKYVCMYVTCVSCVKNQLDYPFEAIRSCAAVDFSVRTVEIMIIIIIILPRNPLPIKHFITSNVMIIMFNVRTKLKHEICIFHTTIYTRARNVLVPTRKWFPTTSRKMIYTYILHL